MIAPTLHLGGSHVDRLLAPLRAAEDALAAAVEALRETAPNGRDYYIQGDHAYAEATADHRLRMIAVESLLHEVKELRRNVEKQDAEWRKERGTT